jgi:hypothetical protein
VNSGSLSARREHGAAVLLLRSVSSKPLQLGALSGGSGSLCRPRIAADPAPGRWRLIVDARSVVRNRVGEFAGRHEDGVVPLAWLEAAIERWGARDDTGRLTRREAASSAWT